MIINPAKEYRQRYREMQKITCENIKQVGNYYKRQANLMSRILMSHPLTPIAIMTVGLALGTYLFYYAIRINSNFTLLPATLLMITAVSMYFVSVILDCKNWAKISLSDRWRMNVAQILNDWNERDFLYCASCYRTELESLNSMFKYAIAAFTYWVSFHTKSWTPDHQTLVAIIPAVAWAIYFLTVKTPLSWVNFALKYYSHTSTYDANFFKNTKE